MQLSGHVHLYDIENSKSINTKSNEKCILFLVVTQSIAVWSIIYL